MHENSPDIYTSQTPQLSVTELSDALKITIDRAFGIVRIKGEVSGFKPASSGHIYFNLKDDKSILKAVCWRGVAASLKVKIEEGMEVVVQGKIAIYQGGSYYQIIASNIEISGIGALLALLEKRRKQLEAEGLFALTRKKLIPFMPRIIGVITSPTGAVIRDILHRIADRFPVHVIVWPVAVQGTGAAEQIANAIIGMNKLSEDLRPDTIIVARGGGSVEDLWCFNEEIVVRAAANSTIPLISAVGHETDTTLIDFASDKRAPTPTAAAEMAVPVKLEMQAGILKAADRLKRTLPNMLRLKELKLSTLASKLTEVERKFLKAEARLDAISQKIRSALVLSVTKNQTRIINAQKLLDMNMTAMLRNNNQRFSTASRLFESLQYKNVLKRGFIVAKSSDGKVISSIEIMKKNALIKLEFADGEADVMQVTSKSSGKSVDKKNQGALF